MKRFVVLLIITSILVTSDIYVSAKNSYMYVNNPKNTIMTTISIFDHFGDISASYSISYGNNELWVNVSDIRIVNPQYSNYGCSIIGWPYSGVGYGLTLFLPIINGGSYFIKAKLGDSPSYSSEYMGGVKIVLLNENNISVYTISCYDDAWVGESKIGLCGIFGSGHSRTYGVWKSNSFYIRNGFILIGSSQYKIHNNKLGIAFPSCYYLKQRPFIPTYVYIKFTPSKIILI